MNLDYVFEFITLTETKNYSTAAEKHNITQPQLSRHIQKLESDLGVSLFVRSTQNVEISNDGLLFLPFATRMLRAYEEYHYSKNTQRHERNLILGVSYGKLDYDIYNTIKDFSKEKHINVKIIEDQDANLKANLLQNKCDFVIVRESPEISISNDFVRLPYTCDEVCAILPTDHPLARNEQIQLTDLANEEFIILNAPMLRFLVMNACKNAGFQPKIAYTINYGTNLFDMVAHHMGIALMVRHPSIQADVAVIPILPKIITHVNIVYRNSPTLSLAVTQFLSYMKKH
ncbi:MAG: LysR family transcriptional regulator [Lachnospiraceae bacterium]|nr:LysR family transcriptional regulator [Lachnospiraceae bacterium]